MIGFKRRAAPAPANTRNTLASGVSEMSEFLPVSVISAVVSDFTKSAYQLGQHALVVHLDDGSILFVQCADKKLVIVPLESSRALKKLADAMIHSLSLKQMIGLQKDLRSEVSADSIDAFISSICS